jgi:hypothetical protein
MPRIVFVLGLCGSGKSTRARKLNADGLINFDEKVTGRPVHPDLAQWPRSAYRELLEAIVLGQDCVVTEIYFYRPEAQQHIIQELRAIRPDVVIEWECFDAADVDLANYNCKHDPDRTTDGIVANLNQNERTVECLRVGTFIVPPGARLLRTERRQRACRLTLG